MFNNSKRWGLVIPLMAALVFMGINSLDAKKPVKETWAVTIPYDSTNLYGFPYAELDGNNVTVSVKKYKGGPTTGYYFQLTIENDPDPANYSQVGFQYLNLSLIDSADFCCYFPTSDCLDPIEEVPPTCMQTFLENQPHPACDYKEICLIIRVDCDIEAIEGGSITSSGWVMIDVRNSFEAFKDACGDFHNIVSSNNVEEMEISRVTSDEWTIRIDDEFVFQETYRLLKNKKRWETKIPLTATTPFSFVTTWTRSK